MNYKKLLLSALCVVVQGMLLAYSPQGDKIKSRWAKEVSPTNVWKSYPRPQLEREEWQNLNGLWEYGVTAQDVDKSQVEFEGKILVPFAIESSLSGVQRSFLPTDILWYRREFTIDPSLQGKNIILHFGAVDYECRVWINGKLVGGHKGGNNPFSFDITKYVKRGSVAQTIELSVVDPTDSASISRGKQQLNQRGIWYTPVSGIWQTVWLEAVMKSHIEQILPTADIDAMTMTLNVMSSEVKSTDMIVIDIFDGDDKIKSIEQKVGNGEVKIAMPNATLWSPSTPKLYHYTATLKRGAKVMDHVKSYFTMREVEIIKDECGYNRIGLNGEVIFQYATLDQGWWPDGLLTPPSEEAMLFDMVKLKEMGFNTIRKHIKVEPEQYYYYADSLGIMLWQDMVSGFATARKQQEHVSPRAAKDWDAPEEHSVQWQAEMFEMIDRLRFYQSITSWVVFNEGWGQHNTAEIVNKVIDYDKSRIINGVTGWKDRGVGHMYDVHNYPLASMIIPEFNDNRISVLGEFGGYGWAVDGHLWNPEMRNWGYKTINGAMELMDNYGGIIYDLKSLIAQGLSAAIYTQTTDVEGEVNGLMTYDREVVKMPAKLLHMMHSELYDIAPVRATTLVEDCQSGESVERYVSIDGAPMKMVAMPFMVEADAMIVTEVAIDVDREFDTLSLWLSIAGKNVTVTLNGVEILRGTYGQTRQYNQFNLSNYADYLTIGENRLRIEFKSSKAHSFDFGLRAF